MKYRPELLEHLIVAVADAQTAERRADVERHIAAVEPLLLKLQRVWPDSGTFESMRTLYARAREEFLEGDADASSRKLGQVIKILMNNPRTGGLDKSVLSERDE